MLENRQPVVASHAHSYSVNLDSVPVVINAIFLAAGPTQKDAERRWTVIQRRFGLVGKNVYNLPEIGKNQRITRQGVFHVETVALELLRRVLVERVFTPIGQEVVSSSLDDVSHVIAILGDLRLPVRQEVLAEQLNALMDIDFVKRKPIVSLLFKLIHIESFKGLAPDDIIWGTENTSEQHQLRRRLRSLNSLLTVESVESLDEFEVVMMLNQALAKGDSIPTTELRSLVELCRSVEYTDDGKIRGKFECLATRADQAERLLLEANKPLDISAMVRTMNHRLAERDKHIVTEGTLRNQLLKAKSRFTSIAKSGLWKVNRWVDVETSPILDLMVRYLHSRNQPASETEIFDYVHARRPDASRNTIKMNLQGLNQSATGIFARDGEQWGLSAWRQGGTGRQQRTPRQRPDGAPEHTRPNGSAKVARVQARIVELVSIAPNGSALLADIRDQLQAEFGLTRVASYQFISSCSEVERVQIPGKREKMCRLRQHSVALFTQAMNIRDARRKQNVERALNNLTEEDVDIGMFLLSKEFEHSLKSFLEAAAAKGMLTTLPSGKPESRNLDNMIHCVKANGFVTETSVLQRLRLVRNDRAHGETPTPEERRILLRAAPADASLYIDYIIFFDDKRLALAVAR